MSDVAASSAIRRACPLLSEALELGASPQIGNMGRMGGNPPHRGGPQAPRGDRRGQPRRGERAERANILFDGDRVWLVDWEAAFTCSVAVAVRLNSSVAGLRSLHPLPGGGRTRAVPPSSPRRWPLPPA